MLEISISIGIGVGLVSIFMGGMAVGKSRNGYVKENLCIKRTNGFTISMEKLHEKINVSNLKLERVETLLEERT